MKVQINQLVKSLLQKDTLEQCSVQELKQFADRHPYFGAAQLLLTKKLQTEKSEQYDAELQKTFLFFHNPLWVEHLLNETGNAEIISSDPVVAANIFEEKKETPVAEEINIPAVAASLHNEPTIADPVAIGLPQEVLNTEATVIQKDKEVEQFIPASTITPVETPVQKDEEPLLAIPAFKIEPIDPAKTELVFEPYYTVDYFASQGIKFKEEEKPKDKFAIQLKSFTDWLKIMKRLPVSEIAKTAEGNTELSAVAEKKVEQLAEHSLEKRDVITEAMAEVWEKQGNMAKAIEIYTKLSLLDPPKSPYFAAKIEALKKTN
jgi:hypothetical protein